MSAHFAAARVRAVCDVATGVRLLEIEPASGAKPYPTGAHLDLAMHIAGLPDVRSYSLVGDRPVDGAYRIAVKRLADSRGGSEHIHSLAPGAELSISEPRSHFELQYGRPEYLLVAGGIGVTPIVGMAHALARHGRPFRLLYAARSRAQMAFAEGSRSCSAIVWSCSRPPKATGSTSPPRSAGSIATASCTSAGRCGSWTRLARRGRHRTGR